jgi:hypothetical protein
MVLSKDFKEFIELLNVHNVKYLVVGGYAVGVHGYPRYTKDLDVWIWVERTNAQNISNALASFGFSGLTSSDFEKEGEFVQLGYPPNRIDIITSCDGLVFEECYPKRIQIESDGLKIDFIDIESLKINKRAAGRPQDLGDLSNLESPSKLDNDDKN